MPYFKWKGITLTGEIKAGKLMASSLMELSNRLLQQHIALISSKEIYLFSLQWSLKEKTKGDIFQQLGDLLRSGMLLQDC